MLSALLQPGGVTGEIVVEDEAGEMRVVLGGRKLQENCRRP